MTVTIDGMEFDRVHYDAGGDVLYLHRADPAEAVDWDETEEGHALRFDKDGRIIGITIVRPRWILDEDGAITLTLPKQVKVGRDQIEPALVALSRQA